MVLALEMSSGRDTRDLSTHLVVVANFLLTLDHQIAIGRT
jgi:hypothetical protein